MPPLFIPGGRNFVEGPTHGFLGWPGGQTVFGRVRGGGYAHWDGVTGMGMRNLGGSPGYNGCFCPADDQLLCVQSVLDTWVLGNIDSTSSCFPCIVADGSCHCEIPGICDPCLGGP